MLSTQIDAIVTISSGEIEADISPTGAGLVALRKVGRDLMPPYEREASAGRYHGSIIAPWANRIEDGQYSFGEENYQLPINEPTRGNALHGFSADVEWSLDFHSPTDARWKCEVGNQPGYPWSLELTAEYSVDDSGVTLRLTTVNLGPGPAPFGAAFHPYFVPGPEPRAQWQLILNAQNVVTPDEERLLPTAHQAVESTLLDFRSGQSAETTFLDHAFGPVTSGVSAVLVSPSGGAIRVAGDRSLPWMQVHTPVGKVHYSRSIVIEPMTSPPNAFASGNDLIELAVGRAHAMKWTIDLSEVSSL